jgi:hypothetical protein
MHKAGPSEVIPEEGIVITGVDSSMCFIVHKDLPGEQNVEVEDSNLDDSDPVARNTKCVLFFSFLFSFFFFCSTRV